MLALSVAHYSWGQFTRFVFGSFQEYNAQEKATMIIFMEEFFKVTLSILEADLEVNEGHLCIEEINMNLERNESRPLKQRLATLFLKLDKLLMKQAYVSILGKNNKRRLAVP